jgi:CheY-like chemotaxis protein
MDDDYITSSLNKLIIQDFLPESELTLFGNPLLALNLIDYNLHYNLEQPDLIFLDIKMPVMDGFEFLVELEKRSLFIPVTMLTTSNYYKDIERAKNFNILDYLIKPLNEAKLKVVIQKLWALKK